MPRLEALPSAAVKCFLLVPNRHVIQSAGQEAIRDTAPEKFKNNNLAGKTFQARECGL